MVKKELDSRETGQRQTGVQKHDTVDTWMEEPLWLVSKCH